MLKISIIFVYTYVFVHETNTFTLRDICKKLQRYPYHHLSDVTDFTDLVLNYENFVDKSLLIKDFLESDQPVIVTRPQKWGKTININMLTTFLQAKVDKNGTVQSRNGNRILFEGGRIKITENVTRHLKRLKIAQHYPQIVKKHQGKYPVIELGFRRKFRSNFSTIEQVLNQKIRLMFHQNFPFLEKYFVDGGADLEGCDVETLRRYIEYEDEQISVEEGFKVFVEALAAHFKSPVYIFVDEYDHLLRNDFGNSSREDFDTFQEQYFRSIRTLLGNIYGIFKDTEKVRGMLIGVSIINHKQMSEEFDLSHFREDTLWEPVFADHFGFTEDEVDTYIKESSMNLRYKEIKHWYKGYKIGDQTMYNPFTITECFREGELNSYWVQTVVSDDAIEQLVPDKIKDEMCTLMYSNINAIVRIPKKINHFIKAKARREEIYTNLISFGYLTAVRISKNHYHVSVPNFELREILFYQIIVPWLEQKLKIKSKYWEDWYLAKLRLSNLLINYQIDQLQFEINELLVWPIVGGNRSDYYRMEKAYFEDLMTVGLLPTASDFEIHRHNSVGDDRLEVVVYILIPATSSDFKQDAIIIGYTSSADRSNTTLILKSESVLHQVFDSSYHRELKLKTFVKKIYTVGIAICKDQCQVRYRLDSNPYYNPSERLIGNKN